MPADVTALTRPPNQQVIDYLEIALRDARSGVLTSVVLVGELTDDNSYLVLTTVSDGWRLLGALEYAKAGVFKSIDM
jgi:hypothetical protein